MARILTKYQLCAILVRQNSGPKKASEQAGEATWVNTEQYRPKAPSRQKLYVGASIVSGMHSTVFSRAPLQSLEPAPDPLTH